jgi:hypothetical protein
LKKSWILPKLWQKNNFRPTPWVSGAILSQNEKTSSTIFPHFQHKQNAKEILRKISLDPKLQLIENWWPFYPYRIFKFSSF